MANDELYTPKFIFDALAIDFDLDVCAPENGPLHTPARKWFSLKDDGLNSQWYGRVWMNPPFSRPKDWVSKWLNHNNGVALIPLAKSNWFKELWDSEAVGIMLPTNTKYIDVEGISRSIPMATSLWALGFTSQRALEMSGLGKLR